MSDESEQRADRYREVARELRHTAFERIPFDLCRRKQLLALATGFDRFADRIDAAETREAAD